MNSPAGTRHSASWCRRRCRRSSGVRVVRRGSTGVVGSGVRSRSAGTGGLDAASLDRAAGDRRARQTVAADALRDAYGSEAPRRRKSRSSARQVQPRRCSSSISNCWPCDHRSGEVVDLTVRAVVDRRTAPCGCRPRGGRSSGHEQLVGRRCRCWPAACRSRSSEADPGHPIVGRRLVHPRHRRCRCRWSRRRPSIRSSWIIRPISMPLPEHDLAGDQRAGRVAVAPSDQW